MGHVAASQDAFRAIADPNRRLMLDDMLFQERTVGDLTRLLGVSQPAVSQHIRVLKIAGLVSERRAGRNVFYQSKPETLQTVQDWIVKYTEFWNARLDALEKHLQSMD
ncbi:MAG: metalloregulator ArsR/SmtB family transcription factor [Alphaproteobacteria bacterium]|nr:metalloregulator ArsR/SmtB family transcription factor [Alphaproteobacteria bacterium]